jgi:hypothetical protein
VSEAVRLEDEPPDEGGLSDTIDPEPAVAEVPAPNRAPFRVTALGMFGAAFLFLLGATVAIVLAQFFPGYRAPGLSIVYSALSVMCVVAAVLLRR